MCILLQRKIEEDWVEKMLSQPLKRSFLQQFTWVMKKEVLLAQLGKPALGSDSNQCESATS